MRRAALIAGVLALLGAGGWFLLRPNADPAVDATPRAEPGATPAPPSLDAMSSRAPVAEDRARDGDAPTAGAAAPSIGARADDGPVLCRLTFLGDGPPPSQVDLEVHPSGGPEGHVRRRATADAWEVRLPRAPSYFVSLTIDGWDSDQWLHDVRPNANDRLELEVRLPARPSILVVDEGTDAALPEGAARMTRGDDTFLEDRPAPALESLKGPGIRADAAGVILLTKTAHATDWWVGAPHHAWARVRVSPDDVARRVALGPGGALRVEVEGVPAGEEAMVGATPAEEEDRRSRQALLAADADTGRHAVEGLPPGRWVVSVGRKADLWVREAWATAEAEVVAGRTTDVRLVVPARDPRARRTVEFELVVPAGWEERPRSMSIGGCADVTDGIERSLVVPGDASLPWRVGVEALKDGPYQVQVAPYGWSTLVRVRRETTIVRVEVPAPAAVRVRVVDEKDGKPLPEARVSVGALDPWEAAEDGGPFLEDPTGSIADEDAFPSTWSGGGKRLGEGREAGSYEGQVFVGEVTISADVAGYVAQEKRVSITASATVFEQVIRLARSGTIEVRIVGAGKTFEAAEGDLEVEPRRRDGDDEGSWSTSTGAGGGKARFDGLPPGTYVVSWRRPKVEVPATKEVTVRAGETVKVEFEAPPSAPR